MKSLMKQTIGQQKTVFQENALQDPMKPVLYGSLKAHKDTIAYD